MFDRKRIMALIPARGGSKGIKRKNIRELCGQPLIVHTIMAARGSSYIDSVFVSTEDTEIAEIANSYGALVPMMRPIELADDDSTTLDVVLHAVGEFINADEWDALVLLQPTQPLRTTEDVDRAIEFFYKNNRKSVVSISEVDDSPILMRYFDEYGNMKKLLEIGSTIRRQEMPKYYRVNGAIYINALEKIDGTTSFNDNELGFVMERSHSIDIDEEQDLILAQYYYNRKNYFRSGDFK